MKQNRKGRKGKLEPMKPKDEKAAPRGGDPADTGPEPICIRQPRKSTEGDAHANNHNAQHMQCEHVLEPARQHRGQQPSSPAAAASPGGSTLEPGARPSCAQSWTALTSVWMFLLSKSSKAVRDPTQVQGNMASEAGSGAPWGRGTASEPSIHRTRGCALHWSSSGAHSLSPP